jgi:hypothetical protein
MHLHLPRFTTAAVLTSLVFGGPGHGGELPTALIHNAAFGRDQSKLGLRPDPADGREIISKKITGQ